MVAPTGFEPVISTLRGWCPRPLDEGAITGWRSRIRTWATRFRVWGPTARRIANATSLYFEILADWEIIQQTPTKQIINYSGVLVPFSPEEKQLLLESKDLVSRCTALEALFQSYIFDVSGEKSDRVH